MQNSIQLFRGVWAKEKPKPKSVPKPSIPTCSRCGKPLTQCACSHNDLRK